MDWFQSAYLAVTAYWPVWVVLSFFLGYFLDHFSKRVLQQHNGQVQRQLEEVKHSQASQMAVLNNLLTSTREIKTESLKDKLRLYQKIIAPVAVFISRLEFICEDDSPGNPHQLMETFYPLRIEVLSQIALFAPKEVFLKFRDLINYMFLIIRTDEPYSLERITELGVQVLSSIRQDIGIANGEITTDDFWMPDNDPTVSSVESL